MTMARGHRNLCGAEGAGVGKHCARRYFSDEWGGSLEAFGTFSSLPVAVFTIGPAKAAAPS
jgi:hypothetical protein